MKNMETVGRLDLWIFFEKIKADCATPSVYTAFAFLDFINKFSFF